MGNMYTFGVDFLWLTPAETHPPSLGPLSIHP